MIEKEIESKVKDALVDVLGGAKEDITPEKLLVDDLGMDSFASLELVFALEDTLGIDIATEDSKCFSTVGDVYKYIQDVLTGNKGVSHAH